METRPQEVHISKDEARGGSTPHIVRYVLLVSLALAVIALSAIWITGAVTTSDAPATTGTGTTVVENAAQTE